MDSIFGPRLEIGFSNLEGNINLSHAFLEKVKHHWGSFSVHEMLQKKLHRVAISNVDAKIKVGWLKLWNGIRFDIDALHFPKSPSLILHLMIGCQSLHVGHCWKKNLLRSFMVFLHLLFNCQ